MEVIFSKILHTHELRAFEIRYKIRTYLIYLTLRTIGLFSGTVFQSISKSNFRFWNNKHCNKLSSDTVPNHTFITINQQALFIYSRTKITGWFPALPLENMLSYVWHSATVDYVRWASLSYNRFEQWINVMTKLQPITNAISSLPVVQVKCYDLRQFVHSCQFKTLFTYC